MSKSKKIFLTRVENTEDIPIPASPHTIASFFIDNWPSPDKIFRILPMANSTRKHMSLILLIISPTVGFHYGKDDYYDLLGEAMCEVYGYVIAHPEEVIYNAAYCYRAYYGLKTGPLVVLALELERTEECYKQKEESHADGARLMEVARTMEALGIGPRNHADHLSKQREVFFCRLSFFFHELDCIVTVVTLAYFSFLDPSLQATWHASYSDMWHALSSGSPSSGSSHKAHMARFSGLPQGRSNDTYKHIIRTAYTIHPDDQHIPSGYNGPDH
ncbi:hypothetical protein CK203_094122 [Vitis vinifera]|uniref:Uncharacterized protein n=1 Tax=Vitis vinifera TaxID=29760 RepID=A0A438CXP5_VITVI|nr:hypothetical protein CK203_094122 [Vitis vinifera]